MATQARQAVLWEQSHRIEDLAETVQGLAYHCTFQTSQVLVASARAMFGEVARMRHDLLLDGYGADDAGTPGRLL
jgi:hypothetical protein